MRTERIAARGLSAPVEVTIDARGVPHIRAQSEPDLWFAQGFVAARDRLWRMDIWRKRGLGLLAADLGPGFLAQDYANRLFLYRGDMAAEWAAYAPDAQAICERFVVGINAFIDVCEDDPERLPPEFGILGTTPGRWMAQDVVRIRTHGMTRNAASEIFRAAVLARADAATDLLRRDLEPMTVPRIAEGIDLASIPLAAADLIRLASAEATITPERLAAGESEIWDWVGVDELGSVMRKAARPAPIPVDAEGSNNWAIAGARTGTGKPVLGSDPHRAHSIPPLRYVTHLTAPGIDLIGAGEPTLPGVVFGHNGAVAFSMTIFYPDQEDVYVSDTAPGDPSRVRYRDGFAALRVMRDTFDVKGAAPRELELRFTPQGPVVFEDRARGKVYSVRSIWAEPGSCPYARSLSTMRATSVADYEKRLVGWAAPSGNHVCADVDGHIGWIATGLSPRRATHDGLTPVPGDGRHEWAGFYDYAELPRLFDPPEGYVATANEMNLPEAFLAKGEPFGFEWPDRSRITRIRQTLGAGGLSGGLAGVEATMALQTDPTSQHARRLAAMARGLPRARDVAGAIDLLKGFEGRLAADSAAAALVEVWFARWLKPAVLAALVPDAETRALMGPGDAEAILRALETPDARFGAEPAQARDALLMRTLAQAWEDCAALMGADPAGWAWGKLHHGAFAHPLAGLPQVGARFDAGPWPLGGSGASPMHTGYRPSDFRAMLGASFRLAVDLADPDNSRFVNGTGQSGDPRSPHYADHGPTWAAGAYFPLPFSVQAVDKAARTRLTLEPRHSA